MAAADSIFRNGASQDVTWNTSAGASAASTAFGSQTYWIRICAVGVISSTVDGVRYQVGDATPTATSTSALLPMNWVEVVQCSPGQKIAVIGNNSTTGKLSITELTH